jgi:hypothetical protein
MLSFLPEQGWADGVVAGRRGCMLKHGYEDAQEAVADSPQGSAVAVTSLP